MILHKNLVMVCFGSSPILGQITFTYGPQTYMKVYSELIEANGEPGEFNTSFTELQRNFVKRCPAKLKDLLRLVKHWYKEIKKVSYYEVGVGRLEK